MAIPIYDTKRSLEEVIVNDSMVAYRWAEEVLERHREETERREL